MLNKNTLDIRKKFTHDEINSSSHLMNDDDYIKKSIQDTLFEKYLETSDLDLTSKYIFAVNANVTKKIVRDLIPKIKTLEDYFYISKVVEQGYFKLFSNIDNLKIKNKLSVSKEFGVFYTPLAIAREMAEEAVLGSRSKIIIDPCVGTGNLLASCMEFAAKNDISLKRLVGVEIDSFAAEVAENSLKAYSKFLGLDVEIEILKENSLDLLSQQIDRFPSYSLPSGTIIINPPYGKIKFESDRLNNKETRLNFNDNHSYKKKENLINLKERVKKSLGILSVGRGALEWSKVFLALCFNKIDDHESLIYIGPCGWLNSVSQNELRNEIIKSKCLSKVHFISEAATGFETVNQPLAIVKINRQINEFILLKNDFELEPPIKYADLARLEHFGYPIPRAHINEINLFIKLQSLPKLKNNPDINNLRGELDQSIDKSVFSSEKTELKIIRGENIGRFKLLSVPNERQFFANISEFETKVSKKPKGSAHKSERLVCRQCSYMKQKRRLVFSIISSGNLVGNSCNYLTVSNDFINLYLGILNSALMDWYFRVMNGNNHVANYEIDDFPIPYITSYLIESIEIEVDNLKNIYAKDDSYSATTYIKEEAKLDALVFKAFKLSEEEVFTVLQNTHEEEYIKEVLGYLINE